MTSLVYIYCFAGIFGNCGGQQSFLFEWVFRLHSKTTKNQSHNLLLDRRLSLCTCFLFLAFNLCFLFFEWFRLHWFMFLGTLRWFCRHELTFLGLLENWHCAFRWTENFCQKLSEANLLYFLWFNPLQKDSVCRLWAFILLFQAKTQNKHTWFNRHFNLVRRNWRHAFHFHTWPKIDS
jgi:hypothetical protein